jgi:hypothetical protein
MAAEVRGAIPQAAAEYRGIPSNTAAKARGEFPETAAKIRGKMGGIPAINVDDSIKIKPFD